MTGNTQWFVVADSTHARVLARHEGEKLRVVSSLEHLASRMKTAELGDDKAGRELSGRGFGGAAFEPRTDAHRKEQRRFAHEIAYFLEREAGANAFESVSLFAPSHFLGELRQELGKATLARLGATRPVDLCAVGPAEIDKRIDQALAE